MRWAVSVALSVLVVAFPVARGATYPVSKTMTIRLISRTTQLWTKVVDRPPKDLYSSSQGDVLQAKSTLHNELAQFGRARGAKVGHDVANYTVVSQAQGDVKVIATLPGGTLRAGGRVSSQIGAQRLRVLGGTGVFAGAKGTSEAIPLSSYGDRNRIVYRLVFP